MRVLIVEDDFTTRSVMCHLLGSTGKCDIAVDGVEAVEAYRKAWSEGQAYDLVCLDIMMPRMGGQDALIEIRKFEEEQGILIGHGAKVIMTTTLSDSKNVLEAFNQQCEGYVVKPVTREKLFDQLGKLELVNH